jgi:hypothetical protein
MQRASWLPRQGSRWSPAQTASFRRRLQVSLRNDCDETYLAGARRRVKVKNRAYWRYELEREGAIRSRQRAVLA